MSQRHLRRCAWLLWWWLALAMQPLPAASSPGYLLASEADVVALLPPPPAADSAEQQADLRAVLEAQRAAHANGTTAHAVADVDASCARFSDALGDDLDARNNATLLAFLNEAAMEGASLAGAPKKYWGRTRPYAYSAQVERLGDVAPDWTPPPDLDQWARRIESGSDAQAVTGQTPGSERAKAANKQASDYLAHSSYPSGHATFATVCAIVLADMVPEKRTQLFARSRDFAHGRLVVGAHFPTDVEAGRILGTVAAQLLMQNASFQRDFARARASLRAQLGLPAETPNLEPGH